MNFPFKIRQLSRIIDNILFMEPRPSGQISSNYYECVINNGFVHKIKSLIHVSMEKSIPNQSLPHILEVGAGSGVHRNFVSSNYGSYTELDIMYELPSQDGNLQKIPGDCQDLSLFESNSFDRLIATCVLAHLADPEKAILEFRRVVKSHGYISLWIPCETNFILRTSQRLTTKRKFKALGDDYDTSHYLEHRNYYLFLDALIRKVFKDDQIQGHRFPFPFLPWSANLLDLYTIKINKE